MEYALFVGSFKMSEMKNRKVKRNDEYWNNGWWQGINRNGGCSLLAVLRRQRKMPGAVSVVMEDAKGNIMGNLPSEILPLA